MRIRKVFAVSMKKGSVSMFTSGENANCKGRGRRTITWFSFPFNIKKNKLCLFQCEKKVVHCMVIFTQREREMSARGIVFLLLSFLSLKEYLKKLRISIL